MGDKSSPTGSTADTWNADYDEEELGIYSDSEGGDDLSDNEPPIEEEDTSGRPQSTVELKRSLRVTP